MSILTVVCAFCAIASAPTFARSDGAPDLAAVVPSINALPEQTAGQKAMKASMLWAVETAQCQPQNARSLLADIHTDLGKPAPEPHAPPSNLFPNIPDFDHNPIAQSEVLAAAKLIKSASLNAQSGTATNGASDIGKAAAEAVLLVDVFCHPQSPYRGDARLVGPILSRFDAVYGWLGPGSDNLNNFVNSTVITRMYWMLTSVYPDLIPPSKAAEWKAAVSRNADAILIHTTYRSQGASALYTDIKSENAYFNTDVRYVQALFEAGAALGRPELTKLAEGGLKLIRTGLYPDGAFAYINTQNDAYAYHACVSALGEIWVETGNKDALELLKDSRNYFPLSIEPPGVAEYATAPSWKHYWNMVVAPTSAMMVASVTGDGLNRAVANLAPLWGNFVDATFYRSDIVAAAFPDRYFVYDRNIQGPRGRFEQFSVVGTGRSTLNDNRGKITYVGCMVLDPPGANTAPSASRAWPLNAALDGAGCRIRIKPALAGDADHFNDIGGRSYLDASRNERLSTIVSRDVASLSATYQLAAYKSDPTQWAGHQLWLFTPDRLVGLVEVKSLADQDAYGIEGSIALVSGRGWWGTRKEFVNEGEKAFSYGKLKVRILESDFDATATQYESTWGNDGAKKLGRIVLLDRQGSESGEGSATHYPAGTRYWYLVEVRPSNAATVSAANRLNVPSGLAGFEVGEPGRTFRVIDNSTDAPIQYGLGSANPQAWVVHVSGEQYRPAWIDARGAESWTGQPETARSNAVTIPAHGHVLLVESATH